MKKILFIILASVLTLACKPSPRVIKGQSPFTGKLRAPVLLQYQSVENLAVGQPATISFSARALVDADSLRVKAEALDGLVVLSGNGQLSSAGAVSRGEQLAGSLEVRGDVAGLKYLSFSAEIVVNGRPQVNTIAIPVVYGQSIEQNSNANTLQMKTVKKYVEIQSK